MRFWKGLTRPSLCALIVTLLVNILLISGLCVYITEEFVAGPMHPYLMASRVDFQIRATSKALKLPNLTTPDIVVIGDSLTVRCFAGERRLSTMVAQEVNGNPPIVYDLTADGIVPLEVAALLDRLPHDFNGILVLGVGPPFLSGDIREVTKHILENPNIGIRSRLIDGTAEEAGLPAPYKSGIYFVDNWRFFLRRRYDIVRNLFITGPQDYNEPYELAPMDDGNRPEDWQAGRYSKWLAELKNVYDVNSEQNFTIIRKLIRRLKVQNGASIILLEAPINPRWYETKEGAEFFTRYRGDLQRLAREEGIRLLSVSQVAGFKAEEFMDYAGHISNSEIRERCTKAIALTIAQHISTTPMGTQVHAARVTKF